MVALLTYVRSTRQLKESTDDLHAVDDNSMLKNNVYKYEKGHELDKFFPFFGWFSGQVVAMGTNAKSEIIYSVKYEDGDIEDSTEAQTDEIS